MTVLFSDMERFTTISEELSPRVLVRFINEYLSIMSKPILRYGGIIDKYVGDAIMAIWGPSATDEKEQAIFACYAALEKLAALREFREILPRLLETHTNLPAINMRIGISTGPMVAGIVGTDIFRGFTVLGDAVNIGSQLESVNKYYGTRILTSEATRILAGDGIEAREIDFIQIVGKEKVMRIFELQGKKGELDETQTQLRARFEDGLLAYRNRDWAKARNALEACLVVCPDDGPSKTFLARIAEYAENPPPQGWSGVFCIAKH